MNRQNVLNAMGVVLCLALLIAGIGMEPRVQAAQEHAGSYSQEAIQLGLRMYGVTCTTCHGPNGNMVPGVDLRTGQFERAPSDEELMRLIRTGIPGTAMPPGLYSDEELMGIVAYLRTMGESDPGEVAVGDVARGEAIYKGKGECATCHRVDGVGSRLGPDLSAIGANRTAGVLETKLRNPTASMFPINRPVRIVTEDGTEYTGRRLNEDTYTVQIIDQDERLRSFEKSALREFTLGDESTMPAYGSILDQQEISDVVAYLLSLRGLEE